MNPICNYEDMIDSRDVEARIETLKDKMTDTGENNEFEDGLDHVERHELIKLQELQTEGENFGDWSFGATLIRDSYFETYAQNLAEDIGAVDPDASWPLSYIDWERAAEALQMDYSSVTFDGITYWIR